MITYNITTKLPTLNEYINLERTNKYAAAAFKKKFTKVCATNALVVKNKLNQDAVYSLIINWTTDNNRSDADNIYFGVKFILDGLVESGALENDNRKHIKDIHHNIETGKKYNIEINLVENAD